MVGYLLSIAKLAEIHDLSSVLFNPGREVVKRHAYKRIGVLLDELMLEAQGIEVPIKTQTRRGDKKSPSNPTHNP